jgi:hypothetical protein
MPDATSGLEAGGFDWSAGALDEDADEDMAESEAGDDSADKKKKKKKRAEIQVDRTAQMDVNGPQTAGDFERLLLGQPDSSELWMQYMGFQAQVSEPAKAREIAERALKTINIREEAEKLNIWTAYLNLENAYGTTETLEEVFKRACQYNDEQVVHERLTTIYIKTGKHKVNTDQACCHSRIDANNFFRRPMNCSRQCSRSSEPSHHKCGPTTDTSCTTLWRTRSAPVLSCPVRLNSSPPIPMSPS